MTLVLRDYQQRAVELTGELWKRGVKRILLQLPTGGGKCLGLGTPVLRFDGRIVPVEKVCQGDLLMGPDSRPRRVLSTTLGFGELYRVIPTRGATWVCNDVHVLTLVRSDTDEVIDVELREWMGETNYFRHVHKLFSPPRGVEFQAKPSLPLDPYFLGVWFGDGTHRRDLVAVSKPDPEILACVESIAAKYGLRVRTDFAPAGCPTHHLVVPQRGQKNPLLIALRDLVGEDMRVPHEYLVSSREDRLAFLAGWIDTDGHQHVNGGSFEVVQKRADWAEAIAFLARSLGFRVMRSDKFVAGSLYHRVLISGETCEIPTRIPRKQAKPRRQKKVATRSGFRVEALGAGRFAGFELDGDGRFLLGDFTVTHNTVIGARYISGAVAKGNRALFLAHRREIVGQSYWKLHADGVPLDKLGVLMADGKIHDPATGLPHNAANPAAACIVASVPTWVARPAKPPAHIVFIDEAHHCTAKTWRAIIDHYAERGAIVIGLTATPERADGRGLGDLFDHMLVVERPSALIANGHLAMPRCFVGEPIEALANVSVRRGDYEVGELDKVMREKRLIGKIVEHYQHHAEGRSTVVFAVSVAHSKDVVAKFLAAGIRAEHLDGETPAEERDAILARFASGETPVVANAMVLTEGWDCPRAKMAIIARPTKSLALYLQMAGRVLRPWNNVSPKVLDQTGDVIPAFGTPDEDRDWTLEGKKREKKSTKKVIRPACKQCGCILAPGQTFCPECGAERPSLAAAGPVELSGVMREVQRTVDASTVDRAKNRERQRRDEEAFLAAKSAVNRQIGRIANAVVADFDCEDREAAIKALNKILWYRLGKKSRNDATPEELEEQSVWLASRNESGTLAAVEEVAWHLGVQPRTAAPVQPPPPPPPKSASVQYSLFGAPPVPVAPPPKVQPEAVAPPPKVRIPEEMSRALDRALAAYRAAHPEDMHDHPALDD